MRTKYCFLLAYFACMLSGFTLPQDASIIFTNPVVTNPEMKEIYVMNDRGGNVKKIDTIPPRNYRHVAMNYDHTKVAATEAIHEPQYGEDFHVYKIWIFDLATDQKWQMVFDWFSAGIGGVDFDPENYVYFSAIRQIDSNPRAHIFKVDVNMTHGFMLTNDTNSDTDVSVSPDGSKVAYVKLVHDEALNTNHTEIWVMNADGTDPQQVVLGGEDGVDSVHDPEISFDNQSVVYSRVNNNYKNYPNFPGYNTAHDIWLTQINTGESHRVSEEGAISFLPDIRQDDVIWMMIRESDGFFGVKRGDRNGIGNMNLYETEVPIVPFAKWIPNAGN